MAFTPSTTMPGEDWWSPAAIVMVFEIDQSGFGGFMRAGIGIIAVWIFLTLTSFIVRWIIKRRSTNVVKSAPETKVQPELSDPE